MKTGKISVQIKKKSRVRIQSMEGEKIFANFHLIKDWKTRGT